MGKGWVKKNGSTIAASPMHGWQMTKVASGATVHPAGWAGCKVSFWAAMLVLVSSRQLVWSVFFRQLNYSLVLSDGWASLRGLWAVCLWLFQVTRLVWECLSAVLIVYICSEREGPSESGHFQGLPEAFESFTSCVEQASLEGGLFYLLSDHLDLTWFPPRWKDLVLGKMASWQMSIWSVSVLWLLSINVAVNVCMQIFDGGMSLFSWASVYTSEATRGH